MDVSALNLATPAVGDDVAVAAGATVGGDAFAKLLSGLTAAAPLGEAPPASEGEASPQAPDLSVLLGQALPAARTRGEASARTGEAVAEETPEMPAEEQAPTAASLGLPPLMAALVAPTLAQAAPVETSALPAASAAATAGSGAGAPGEGPVTGGQGVTALAADIVSEKGPAAGDAAGNAASKQSAAPLETAIASVGDDVKSRFQPATIAPLPSLRRGLDATAAAPGAGSGETASIDKPRVAIEPALAGRLPAMPMPAFETTAVTTAPDMVSLEAAGAGEQMVERQLDLAQDGEWLDQLARDIVRTAGSEGVLKFKLNPETLGSLHVEVTQGQAGASVRLTADTEQARAIIADARPQLIAEARSQGVRIAEAHVDLGGHGQPQGHSQAGQGQRDGRDQIGREYLTSWKPESDEDRATPPKRSTAERYA